MLRERFGGGQEKESFPEPPRAPALSPGAELEGRAVRPLRRRAAEELKVVSVFRFDVRKRCEKGEACACSDFALVCLVSENFLCLRVNL